MRKPILIRDSYVVQGADVACSNFFGRAFIPRLNPATHIDTWPSRINEEHWRIVRLEAGIANTDGTVKQGVLLTLERLGDGGTGGILLESPDIQYLRDLVRTRDQEVWHGVAVILRPGACIAGDILITTLEYEVLR